MFFAPAVPEPLSSPNLAAAGQDRQVLAMGTRLTLHLEGSPTASQAALAAVEKLEALGSTWRADSEWSRVNAAQGQPTRLSPESFALLARAQAWSQRTQGAFDPLLLPLVQAWGLRRGGATPSERDLAAAREASGAGHLDLDPNTHALRLKHPAAGIEEGAFLKGAALDALRAAATSAGANSGWADFGGQMLAWGRPFPAQVAHPHHRERPILSLRLQEASLSCSGCSERGSHLLDPRSGRPCADWGSVAVVCASAFDADVLSTALYVMGPVQGLAWAERHQIAACFLPHAGPARLSAAFRALNPVFLKESK